MTSFAFRLRFHIPQKGMLEGSEREVSVDNGRTLKIKALNAEKISDTTRFCISSEGYSTERWLRNMHIKLRMQFIFTVRNIGLELIPEKTRC